MRTLVRNVLRCIGCLIVQIGGSTLFEYQRQYAIAQTLNLDVTRHMLTGVDGSVGAIRMQNEYATLAGEELDGYREVRRHVHSS